MKLSTGGDRKRVNDREIFSKREQKKIKSAVERLKETERDAIQLRFWEAQSIQDIASILCLSWTEADALLDRALKKLRKICLSEFAIHDRSYSMLKNAA